MDERVGITMHQLPLRAAIAMDLGCSERPVLVGQAANLGLLPLDHDEKDEDRAQGIRTADRRTLEADLVVDATGRRRHARQAANQES